MAKPRASAERAPDTIDLAPTFTWAAEIHALALHDAIANGNARRKAEAFQRVKEFMLEMAAHLDKINGERAQ